MGPKQASALSEWSLTKKICYQMYFKIYRALNTNAFATGFIKIALFKDFNFGEEILDKMCIIFFA